MKRTPITKANVVEYLNNNYKGEQLKGLLWDLEEDLKDMDFSEYVNLYGFLATQSIPFGGMEEELRKAPKIIETKGLSVPSSLDGLNELEDLCTKL